MNCAAEGAVGSLRSGSELGHPTRDQMWGQPSPNKGFLIALPSSRKRENLMMQHFSTTASNLILKNVSLISQTQ